MEQLKRLHENLLALGARKLAALGLTFLAVVALVSIGGVYLSRPDFEVLYSGLDREDVSRIGAALKENGIGFDINRDSNAVSVHYGQTAQARMLLAERGLPQNPNAGYELFDKVGSLGLTSFMQEITRVRALEGELARTIQVIRGVKAARVHIVMPDEGAFRRAKQAPSASVVIRMEGAEEQNAARAIRHLVAAAIPGMTADQVTVITADGALMMQAAEDSNDAAPIKALGLEKTVAADIQENIRRTLAPYLRLSNFQVSVRARLNTDRKQVNETIYDPDSRVERSVRVVKENSLSQNNASTNPASVERNLPQDKSSSDAKQSNDENKKSEELTNFELSSKTINTVSGGYAIENLSIAVVVNRASLAGGDKQANADAINREMREIEQLVASAAGVKKERGDVVKISAVDFVASEEITPIEGPGWKEHLARNTGAFVNALALLAVAGLVVWFGVRPATQALLAQPAGAGLAVGAGPEQLEAPPLLALEQELQSFPAFAQMQAGGDEDALAGMDAGQRTLLWQKKLEHMVDSNEQLAATILKQWMYSEDSAS